MVFYVSFLALRHFDHIYQLDKSKKVYLFCLFCLFCLL